MAAGNKPPLGFVGLGDMGGHMARNLLAAGYELVVFDLDAARVAACNVDSHHCLESAVVTGAGNGGQGNPLNAGCQPGIGRYLVLI